MTTEERVNAHFNEALNYFPEKQIVLLALQGSQNYGLETPKSDVDTKLLVTPTLEDIAQNRNPVSYTYIRANDEHIDFKDVRIYIDLFKKQNPNFMEILFSKWVIISTLYQDEVMRLIKAREEIAHMNIYRATHAIMGMMQQKYHAMEHPYPSKLELIRRYGYDGKQLSHMLRLEEFMERYLKGESYRECLIPKDKEYLIMVKENKLPLDTGRELAAGALRHGQKLLEEMEKVHKNEDNPDVVELLKDVQYKILRTSLREELK